eukprot:CAMPEP_0198693138 /NCGR_PEP_ID=MMETSP1468-20131203/244294_1 /TAXON_ID=1461545 /ORGANISM="Mantoniella sp, Strain CCMP1436" /LENGTH=93 /DNA_ID=CAMNT_0044447595 /DNA_START=246 /DNA_END=523 /DNA_ORIENTATION=-
MRELYVKMFASTPSAFISANTSIAISHARDLPQALISALYVMVFASTPRSFITPNNSMAFSHIPARPHNLMSVVNAGAPGRNVDAARTAATSP